MNKDDFVKYFQNLSLHKDNVISKEAIELVMQYYSDYKKEKLPVIWLETNDSGDNNISFMNTTYPYLDRVFTEMIDLLYSNTFMAAQGKDALDILNNTAKYYAGKFTLVVEGAIPIKDQGLYNVIAVTEQQPLTALKVVTWLGGLAKYVVAIGTCASFGGPSGARPNLTGSMGVKDVLKRQVVNVSGCPVNPDWFVGTLAHLILYGMPDLDELGRPKLFYGFTIHRHCQRRSYFDRNQFALKLGDIECMFSLGCMGPRTGADCPYRLWVNHVNWPVKANTPCIGCTNADFPDGSTPFFTPMPEKSPQE
ncbi:MAG TPA: hydrogenase small subunit [Thermoanaerobacterales bacterium]|nr:hydrogenase small subunit [Thermoanaerobacterales bacterium]